jgi:PAT family beta-lactamase induction signal transducer AmpG
LGMMLPGMASGWLQEMIGYQHFFIWVMVATIPSFLICWFVEVDEDFGRESSVSESDSESLSPEGRD